MSQLLLQAAVLATEYHSFHPLEPENAFRKSNYSGAKVPYVVHIFDVLKLLFKWGIIDEITLAAAIGHDLFEDTRITFQRLVEVFGQTVAGVILELTFKPTAGITGKQKAAEKSKKMESYRSSSIRSYVVKIADRLKNVIDFWEGGDKTYALTYFHKADVLWDALSSRKEEIVQLYGENVYTNIHNSINDVYVCVGGNSVERI